MTSPPDDPYPQHQYQPPVADDRTNTMAILSLVFAFVFWPLGIVFGHLARRQLRQTGEGGANLATVGLVLSYVFGALTLLACLGWIALVIYAAGHPGVLPSPTYR